MKVPARLQEKFHRPVARAPGRLAVRAGELLRKSHFPRSARAFALQFANIIIIINTVATLHLSLQWIASSAEWPALVSDALARRLASPSGARLGQQ